MFRPLASVAEAVPSIERGTLPITSELFGDMKIALPIPIRASRTMIHGAVVSVFNDLCDDATVEPIVEAFKSGISVETGEALAAARYDELIGKVDGLRAAVQQLVGEDNRPAVQASAAEFVLEGLHLNKRLNKDTLSGPGHSLYRG